MSRKMCACTPCVILGYPRKHLGRYTLFLFLDDAIVFTPFDIWNSCYRYSVVAKLGAMPAALVFCEFLNL